MNFIHTIIPQTEFSVLKTKKKNSMYNITNSVLKPKKFSKYNITNSILKPRKTAHATTCNKNISSRKFCMLIFTILHVIHQSSVPRKFCILIFTNSAYQFQKNSAIYKGKKRPVLTSTVFIEAVLVSACIFHVSAPKPVATNQLRSTILEHYKDLENRSYH